jgi:hypothetical protein
MAQPEPTPESTLREEPIILLFCLIDDALPHAQPKKAKYATLGRHSDTKNSRPRTLSTAPRYHDTSSLIVLRMRSIWPSRSSQELPGRGKSRVRMEFATCEQWTQR